MAIFLSGKNYNLIDLLIVINYANATVVSDSDKNVSAFF